MALPTASDNVFTRFLISEGGSTATPAANRVTMYAKADGLLYSKDDAGVETLVSGGGGGATFDPDVHMQWHIPLIPMIWTPEATTGTWAIAGFNLAATSPFITALVSNSQLSTFRCTSAAQNDAAAWDVVLAAGTWDATFYFLKAASFGIITLNQDGSSMGTLDGYAAATAYATGSITGWTVSATGKKRMQLLMATKNASSSAYGVAVIAIEFRRTA